MPDHAFAARLRERAARAGLEASTMTITLDEAVLIADALEEAKRSADRLRYALDRLAGREGG